MELGLIILIVALAGGYWARSVLKTMKPKPTDSSCGCGCSGCAGSVGDQAQADPTDPEACKSSVISM